MPAEFSLSLEALKKDIESRKQENIIKEQTSGRGGVPKTDKHTFLRNLRNSVNGEGVNNPAVEAIRAVSESTEAKFGVPEKVRINSSQTHTTRVETVQNNHVQQNVQPQQQFERGDDYFDRQMRLGEERLRALNGQPQQQNNGGLSQVLTEYNQAPFIGQNGNQNYGAGLNASMLNEHIRKTMVDVLANSTFDKLVEDTFRNVITEMYTKEKIEAVINEFIQTGKFKTIVDERIKELRQINEAKRNAGK